MNTVTNTNTGGHYGGSKALKEALDVGTVLQHLAADRDALAALRLACSWARAAVDAAGHPLRLSLVPPPAGGSLSQPRAACTGAAILAAPSAPPPEVHNDALRWLPCPAAARARRLLSGFRGRRLQLRCSAGTPTAAALSCLRSLPGLHSLTVEYPYGSSGSGSSNNGACCAFRAKACTSGCVISDSEAELMRGIGGCSGLEELTIRGLAFTFSVGAGLGALAACGGLRVLDLSHARLEPEKLWQVADRSLWLGPAREAVSQLCAIMEASPLLEVLRFPHLRFPTPDALGSDPADPSCPDLMATIAGGLKSLRCLQLAFRPLAEQHVKALERCLPRMAALTDLSLELYDTCFKVTKHNTTFDWEGVGAVAAPPALRRLAVWSASRMLPRAYRRALAPLLEAAVELRAERFFQPVYFCSQFWDPLPKPNSRCEVLDLGMDIHRPASLRFVLQCHPAVHTLTVRLGIPAGRVPPLPPPLTRRGRGGRGRRTSPCTFFDQVIEGEIEAMRWMELCQLLQAKRLRAEVVLFTCTATEEAERQDWGQQPPVDGRTGPPPYPRRELLLPVIKALCSVSGLTTLDLAERSSPLPGSALQAIATHGTQLKRLAVCVRMAEPSSDPCRREHVARLAAMPALEELRVRVAQSAQHGPVHAALAQLLQRKAEGAGAGAGPGAFRLVCPDFGKGQLRQLYAAGQCAAARHQPHLGHWAGLAVVATHEPDAS